MSFTSTQVRKLRARLKPQHIKTRDAEGVSLSYVEGWHVLAEANRIFGFDGWDRETISSECVWTKQLNGRYCAAYVTRIRIRVRAGEAIILREGSGAGESNAATAGQAHEFAAKAAETDATKRALMTFGNAFGLSLYGGSAELRDKASNSNQQRGVGAASSADAPPNLETPGRVEEIAPGQFQPETEGREAEAAASDIGGGQPCTGEPPAAEAQGTPWPVLRPLDEASRLAQARATRIDKSSLAVSEPRRIRDLGHLAFVASRPCLVCGRNRSHAHHLKFAQPTALGRKVSDEFTVPLCAAHHRELHQHGDERVWWAARGIDALQVAGELWLGRRPPPPRVAELADQGGRTGGSPSD